MRAIALMVLLATPSARALPPVTDAVVRLGAEGGATWRGSRPDQAFGPAGGLRARLQLTERGMASVGILGLRQPLRSGPALTATLLPAALELRLDRALVSPFLGAGGVLAFLQRGRATGRSQGWMLEAGLEIHVSPTLAATVQATYLGLQLEPGVFPLLSAWTAGVEAKLGR